ncbi:MAG: ABC transporter substrate-binding protein [Pseudomonadales bacterium]|nr:ABC transporter substrate-binding protein [Pseudomonadales bacterium]
MRTRRVLTSIFLATLAFGSQANVLTESLQAGSAEEAVVVATKDVLDLISSKRVAGDENPVRFYAEVKELLDPIIDFDRFARSVMGVWYKKASPEQFETFSESFKWSLVKTYASALTEFHGGQVRVVPVRGKRELNKALVAMEIDWRGKTYSIVYDMRKKSETWQLVNVSVEGINLGLNYKSQFDSAMKGPKYGRDLDRVIAAWTNQIGNNDSESGEGSDAR